MLLFRRVGNVFLEDVSYDHQGSIYLIKDTVKAVELWNVSFQQPVLQCHGILQKSLQYADFVLSYNFFNWKQLK